MTEGDFPSILFVCWLQFKKNRPASPSRCERFIPWHWVGLRSTFSSHSWLRNGYPKKFSYWKWRYQWFTLAIMRASIGWRHEVLFGGRNYTPTFSKVCMFSAFSWLIDFSMSWRTFLTGLHEINAENYQIHSNKSKHSIKTFLLDLY